MQKPLSTCRLSVVGLTDACDEKVIYYKKFVSCSPFHGTFEPSRTRTETSWPSLRAALTIALPKFPVAAITRSFISTKPSVVGGQTGGCQVFYWWCPLDESGAMMNVKMPIQAIYDEA